MIRGQHLLPFRLFLRPIRALQHCSWSSFSRQSLFKWRGLYRHNHSQSAPSDHSSGLPSCCTLQEEAGPPLNARMFSARRITLLYIGPSLPPRPHTHTHTHAHTHTHTHLLQLFRLTTRAVDLFLRFPRLRLEMPIMSYQDGGSIKY